MSTNRKLLLEQDKLEHTYAADPDSSRERTARQTEDALPPQQKPKHDQLTRRHLCHRCLQVEQFCHCEPSERRSVPADGTRVQSLSEVLLDYRERNKMLTSQPFRQNAECLIEDRRQCSQAVSSFNKAAHGNDTYPRESLEQIISLRPSVNLPLGTATDMQILCPRGEIGRRCEVEAPFNCTYGYNIRIGTDVTIRRNCKIHDAGSVEIGDGVIVGENVTIISGNPCVDPHERLQGRALAKRVTIQAGAWIGPSSTLFAGVNVGRCSTVMAGSVVVWNVPDFSIVDCGPGRPQARR